MVLITWSSDATQTKLKQNKVRIGTPLPCDVVRISLTTTSTNCWGPVIGCAHSNSIRFPKATNTKLNNNIREEIIECDSNVTCF